jgi:broad specificity phosphatase PhoE
VASVQTVTTLLLVRHGETDWNRDQRWQGHSDPPLNERGREQARALAATLESPDRIYASDLARARDTAAILAERLRVPVTLDERLRERGFGAWEGLTMAEIEARFAADHTRWRAGEGAGAVDAEPFETFAERVGSFLHEVLERHPDEDVLIVAHGGTIRVIHALASGLDYVRDHRSIPAVDNCVPSKYAFRNGKLAPID